jgi:BioD-like phosphotransacetylase family protein
MKNSLYISSSEKSAGSFIAAIGIFHHLKKLFKRVGFFRPIGSEYSSKIELMNEYFQLDEDIHNCYGVSKEVASKLIAENKMNNLSEMILQKYNKYKKNYDFVLLHGFNSSSLDFNINKDFNISIAKNLNSLFMPVLNGYNKSISNIKEVIQLEKHYIEKSKVSHL